MCGVQRVLDSKKLASIQSGTGLRKSWSCAVRCILFALTVASTAKVCTSLFRRSWAFWDRLHPVLRCFGCCVRGSCLLINLQYLLSMNDVQYTVHCEFYDLNFEGLLNFPSQQESEQYQEVQYHCFIINVFCS